MKRLWIFIFLFVSNLLSNPRVSIITSVFKGDVFIADFMREIVKQTIFDQCELLLINANSPGNEEAAILPYLKKYPNIIYTKLEKDPGLYAVWNIAIKGARGEYIINANLDDGLAYNALEKKMKFLDENPDIDLVYSDFYHVYKPIKSFYDLNPWITRKIIMPEFSLEALAKKCMPNHHPMWRKFMHDKHGYFDEQYFSSGDYDMWIRAALGGSKFKRLPEIMGFYYCNPGGISTNANTRSHRESAQIREVYKDFFALGEPHSLFDSLNTMTETFFHKLSALYWRIMSLWQ